MAGLWQVVIPTSADDVNEPTNPSFELGTTTDWLALGTNTIAASTEQQYRGAYSMKVTYQDNTTLANYSHTFLNASTTYYVKIKVYVPSTWNGTTLSITGSSLTGATITAVTTWTTGDATATWVELKSTFALAADVDGTINLVTTGSPTAGLSLYFDAFQISTNDSLYFDGDDPMAFWRGNRHASASQMDYRNRAAGVATNLDDLNVFMGHSVGLDFPRFDNQTRARALGDGSEFQTTYIPERTGQIPLTIIGTSEENYHTRKKAFENVIKPNRTPGSQNFVMRSLAANSDVPNHLSVRLDNDLNLKREGFTGKGVMRLLATNPSWYEAGDKYAALTRYATISVSYLLGFLNDGTGFSNLGNSATGQVRTLAIDENNDLIAGGTFLNFAGNADADNIVRYVHSTGSWTSLFTGGANSNVNKIIFLDDGRMVIVGAFTSIGGTAANRAAIWDGSTITAFSTGFNGEVNTVAFDYHNNKLYFGGAFTTPYNYIAAWNLTSGAFEDLDSGANADVRTIALDPSGNGVVYAGGEFTTVGSPAVTAYYMAKYTPSSATWSKLTAGSSGATTGTNGPVYSIVFDDGARLFVGGDFTAVAGISADNVAYRLSSNPHWYELGGGVTGGTIPVEFMYWDTVTQTLLISGQFTSAASRLIDQAVVWNGSSFSSLGLDFPGSTTVYAFIRNQSNGDYFYAFDTSGSMKVPSTITSVTNTGTDNAFPKVVFVGTGTINNETAKIEYLANLTTGARVSFNDLAIYEGSELVIEFSPTGAKVYRIVGQQTFDLTAGAFTRDSDISKFTLLPGLNLIALAAPDVNNTPTISCYLLWRNRHNSLSGTAA